MLYTLFVWTLLLVGCYGVGLGVLHGLKAYPTARLGDRAIIAVWLGILVLALTLLATALLLPLSPLVGGSLLLSFSLLSLRSKAIRAEVSSFWRQITSVQIGCYLSIATIIAAFMSYPVLLGDTGLYHYSVIRWLADFGTVPGVALLFANFGFTSAWFAFSAPLNPGFLTSQATAVANGFVYLLAVLQLCSSLYRIFRRQGQISDGLIAICYGCLLSLTSGTGLLTLIISASPDVPILFLTPVIAWAILLAEVHSQVTSEELLSDRVQYRRTIPLLLAVGAVSIKLTALPVLLTAGLWFVFGHGFNPFHPALLKRQIALVGLISLLLLPFLLTGITTSGCPLFPSKAFCLDLPWSLSDSVTRSVANSTHSWIQWYGEPPEGIHPLRWALGHWIKEFGNRVVVALILLTVISALYLFYTRRNQPRAASAWIVALSMISTAFFMSTAPFKRFMFSYLFLVPALALAVRYQSLLMGKVVIRFPQPSLQQLTIGLTLIATCLSTLQIQDDYTRFLLPPALKSVESLQKKINDVSYFSPPSDELCWTIPLPCAYTVKEVKLRDPSRGIAGGFIKANQIKASRLK